MRPLSLLTSTEPQQSNILFTVVVFYDHTKFTNRLMSENIPIDQTHLTELIRNPTVVRIVSILDLASLSILELLEYNLYRREINYALSERVIATDKLTTSSPVSNILLSGDYYYNFLSSKARLTELGLYILDSIKGEVVKKEIVYNQDDAFDVSPFGPTTRP